MHFTDRKRHISVGSIDKSNDTAIIEAKAKSELTGIIMMALLMITIGEAREMLSVAVVEDDKNEAEALLSALKRYKADTGEEMDVCLYNDAEKFLKNYKTVHDVIFMDIELPYMNGMEAAAEIRKIDGSVAIIFVTNMAKYAVQGYKVGALDYFLKPISYFDLKLRIEQVRLSKNDSIPVITVPLSGGMKSILSSKVYYIEIMDHSLTYHTEDGNFSLSRGASLKKLEKQLENAGFSRCSSSYLVNLKWCSEIKTDTVKVGRDTLKISRGMKKDFITQLSETVMKRWAGGN